MEGRNDAPIAANDFVDGAFSNESFTYTSAAPTLVSDLIITGVVDGDLAGGLPKALELYVINDIPDLSIYGLGSANNGEGTDGEEFTLSGSASAGDYLYITTAAGAADFQTFFGITEDFQSGFIGVNGDDAIELFKNGGVVDVFGDINTDGTGEAWEYSDGWAVRNSGDLPNGGTFDASQWTFSGPDALDGETTNAGAVTPMPVGTYAPPVQQIAPDTILTNDGIVSGALLNYAAQNNFDADDRIEDDGTWPNTGVVSGGDLTLNSGVSLIDATSANHNGIVQAYSFDGSTSASAFMQGDSPLDVGVTTTANATIEMWFRPETLTGGSQNLWETGGGTGTGLVLRDNNLVFRVIPGGAEVTYDLNDFQADFGYDPTTDYIHAVGAINIDENYVELFINGVLIGRGEAGLSNWDGGDGAGIGFHGGDNQGGFGSGPSGITENFQGDIASFRLYGEETGGTGNGVAFNALQALQNFKAINAGTDIDGNTFTATGLVDLVNDPTGNTVVGLGTQITLASGALVTLDDATGTFTYDPNQAFDFLGLGDVGTDTFTYQVTDVLSAAEINAGAVPGTSTATVTIQIHGVANAIDDTVQVAEDTPTTINVADLLANDLSDRSVGGATLDYNANPLPSGTTVWEGSSNPADNWNFGNNVTLEQVTSAKFAGVSQAFRFDGTGGPDNRGINDLPGDPSDADATWEFILQPTNTGSDDQIIYETGGAGDGMAIWYSVDGTANDLDPSDGVGTIHFTIDDGGVQETVSAALGQDDFSHVALAYDRDSGGRDVMRIFIDGSLAAVKAPTGIDDFDGGDTAGLGNVGNSRGETVPAGAANFTGDMSVFRFYEKSLNSAEVVQNFIAARSPGATVLTLGADSSTTGTVSYDPGTGLVTYTPTGQDPLAFGELGSDTFVYTSSDGTEIVEILSGNSSLVAESTILIGQIANNSFGTPDTTVQEEAFATVTPTSWLSTGDANFAFTGQYDQEPALNLSITGDFAKVSADGTTAGEIGQNTGVNWADLEEGDTITLSLQVAKLTAIDFVDLDVQLLDGTLATGTGVGTSNVVAQLDVDGAGLTAAEGDFETVTLTHTVTAADLARTGTVNVRFAGDATQTGQTALDTVQLTVTSINVDVSPTLSTPFSSLKNVNGGDFASGDTLDISGTNADGSAFVGTFTITDVDTTTLGDFLDALNALMADATAVLGASGDLTVFADAAGDADLSLSISSAAANVGNTDAAPLGSFSISSNGRDATGNTTTATVNVEIRGENDPITANDDTLTITASEDGTVSVGNIITEGAGADTDIDSKQVIISEDFSGAGALDGSSTETGGLTWSAGTLWNADGTKTANGFSNALVPFQPQQGRVYTMSMTVNPDSSGSGDWFAAGFSDAPNPNGGWHTSANTVSGWMLIRENDNAAEAIRTFETEATSGGTTSGHPSPGEGPIDIQIVLDTTEANWAVEWYADGKLLRSTTLASNPTINYAGFGAWNTATGSVSDFQITENVVALGDAIVVAADDDTTSVGNQITVGAGALVTVNQDGSVNVDANGAYDSLPTGATAQETFTYVVADQNAQTVDLAAHLNFGETAVDPDGVDTPPALDLSGNGRNGTLNGNAVIETSTSPVGGSMLTLDGTGDFVTLDGYQGVGGSDVRTMSAWINTSVPGAAGIMSWGSNVVNEKWVWRIADTNGRMRVEVNGGGVESTTNVADGNWHHVVVVYDGSGDLNGVQFYVDGQLETKSVNSSVAINTAAGTDVYVGADRVTANNASRDFTGNIDDAAIWDRALSAQDISDIYQTAIVQGHSFQEQDTATVTITIEGENSAPDAVDDTVTAREAGGFNNAATGIDPTGNVMANDTDADSNDDPAAGDGSVRVTEVSFAGTDFNGTANQTLTVDGQTIIEGAYGFLTINTDGSYRYEVHQSVADSLDEGETVTEQFSYTIEDGEARLVEITGLNLDVDSGLIDLTIVDSEGGSTVLTAGDLIGGTLIQYDGNNNDLVFDASGAPLPAVGERAAFLDEDNKLVTALANLKVATEAEMLAGNNIGMTMEFGEDLASAVFFEAGGSEPVFVQVSQDGVTWSDVVLYDSYNTFGPLLTQVLNSTSGAVDSLNDLENRTANARLTDSNQNAGGFVLNAADFNLDTFRFLRASSSNGSATADPSFIAGIAATAATEIPLTDTATLTITVEGSNDTPDAYDNTNSATEAGGDANSVPGSGAAGNVITDPEIISGDGPLPANGLVGPGVNDALENLGQTLTGIVVNGVTYTDLTGAVAADTTGGAQGALFGALNEGSPASSNDALSGLSVTTGRTNTEQSDFTRASVVNDGDATGIFFGEINISGQAGDAVTVIPLDATGQPIDTWSLSITAADYGDQIGITQTPGLPNISTRLTSFTLADFTGGTGTLTGVAGIRLLDDVGGVDFDPSVLGTFNLAVTDRDVDADDTVGTNPATDVHVIRASADGGASTAVASNTTSANGTTLVGVYGDLTIGSDGSYVYTVDETRADVLDAGDVGTDTFSYTISDGTKVFIDVDGIISGDAKDFTRRTGEGISEWTVVPTEDAGTGDLSGSRSGEFLQILPDTTTAGGSASIAVPNNGDFLPSVEYEIQIEEAGTYQLFVRWANSGANGGGNSDSMFADIVEFKDGVGTGKADWYELNQNTRNFTWDGGGQAEVNVAGPANNAMTWDFDTPGTYTLRFTPREDGAAIDAWALVNTAAGATAPTGTDAGPDSTISQDTATLTITVNGANDDPVAVPDTATATEAGGDANGTAGVDPTGNVISGATPDIDVDGDDTIGTNSATDLFVTQINYNGGADQAVTAGTTSANGTSVAGMYGTLTIGADGSYVFVVDQAAMDAAGVALNESVTDSFTYTVSDDSGATDSTTLLVTIDGANDNPVISVGGGSAGDAFNEAPNQTNTGNGFTANGTLDVSDIDTSNTVDVSVSVVAPNLNPMLPPTSTSTAPDNATLLSYLSVDVGDVIDGTSNDGTINWSFDSGSEEFDFVAAGETYTVTYTITATDSDGGQTTQDVVLTITGANDDPVPTGDTATAFEGGVSGPDTIVGNALANDSDTDDSDTPVVSQITHASGANGAPTATDPAVINGSYGTISINQNGDFVYTVDNGNGTVQALGTGDTLTETFTYEVNDGNGGTATETITVTIQGQDGIAVNGVFITGGSRILEGFRFAESSGFDDREEESNSTGRPILTLIPTYSGSASPGSVITISVLGRNGELLSGGQMTVVADIAGNWIANFNTLILGDSHYFVQIQTKPAAWGPSQPGVFQTFFAPAINPTFTGSQGLSIDSILGRRLSTVGMELLNQANRNPGGTAGNGPLTPQHLPVDLQNLIPPGIDENGASGQSLEGEGEEEENPEETSQGNPNGGSSDGQPGEPNGNQ